MRLTSQGALRLAAIVATCMAKRGEGRSSDQDEMIQNALSGRTFLLKHIHVFFPLEKKTGRDLASFSKARGLSEISDEAVCQFFGGSPHLEYSLRDIQDKGLGGLWPVFLLFHMLLPVKIVDQNGRGFVGVYRNFGREVLLQGVKSIGLEKEDVGIGSRVIIHYGLIVGTVDESAMNQIISDQSKLEKLSEACAKVPSLNCDDLRSIARAG